VDVKELIRQLKGIGGSEQVFTEGALVQSIPDAIAKVLERHLGEVQNTTKDMYETTCRVCGATLPDEKCPVCPNCGWNRCS
jgi:ribonucleoside-diphosphate reductase alpha chain